MQKFALFEFVESDEVEVGETAWIVSDGRNDDDLRQLVTNGTVVTVQWPVMGAKQSKKSVDSEKFYSAKIIQLSGMFINYDFSSMFRIKRSW